MRRLLFRTAAGLCLLPLAGWGLAQASELAGGPATKGARPAPIQPLQLVDSKPTCGAHGTSVEFLATPGEAARKAKKEEKLVFVLHVSGNFEDPRFT